MHSITINRVLTAPIEHVFAQLTNHANYTQFPGVKQSTLVREGTPHKNGVGALREIDAGLAWFREEITAYERPQRMHYVIRASHPPARASRRQHPAGVGSGGHAGELDHDFPRQAAADRRAGDQTAGAATGASLSGHSQHHRTSSHRLSAAKPLSGSRPF